MRGEGGPFCTRKKFTTFDLKEAEEGADDNEEDEGRGGDEDWWGFMLIDTQTSSF